MKRVLKIPYKYYFSCVCFGRLCALSVISIGYSVHFDVTSAKRNVYDVIVTLTNVYFKVNASDARWALMNGFISKRRRTVTR